MLSTTAAAAVAALLSSALTTAWSRRRRDSGGRADAPSGQLKPPNGSAPTARAPADRLAAVGTVCECGVSLPEAAPADMEQHRRSRRHRLNLRLVAHGTQIRVCEQWSEYRHAIEGIVLPSDSVLEIGCHQGVTTALIAARCSRALGVDLSEHIVGVARERFPAVPNLSFEVGDAADVKALRRLGTWDVIFLDINGSRVLQTLLPLLEAYEAVLKPRTIVVKSQRLSRLLLKTRCA